MKTAVLLSGGVDSSVSLHRLKERGDDLTAFYLKVWLEEDAAFGGHCPWEEDVRFSRAVCAGIGVPLEILPLQREYLDAVVSYTVEELRRGRTPSPDIFCNQRIKFGAFLERIDTGFERVASGHYARREVRQGSVRLLKGTDPIKDQTYFLSHLNQSQLSRCLFPIGDLTKAEVRELAAEYDLPSRNRPDSQGLCFLGKIRFPDFVRFHLGERPGEIRDIDSERVLGTHRGYWFHTIGQRKGLGLSGGPWFVVQKDTEQNIVYVAHADRLASRQRSSFRVAPPHWIGDPPSGRDLQVKLRHSEVVFACRLSPGEEGGYLVDLAGEDAGIAPGQFAVFYDGDECLGGAMIVDETIDLEGEGARR